MKRSLLVALAFAGTLTTAAHGKEEEGGNVGVGGSAPATCAFQTVPRQLAANNMSLSSASSASAQLLINQFIDQQTGRLLTASIHIEMLGSCNGPHYVSVSSSNGGLKPAQDVRVVSGSFNRHVNYRIDVSWAGQTATLQTDGVPGKNAEAGLVAGPALGPLGLHFVIDGTGNDMNSPIVAGTYSDLVTVQIGLPL